MSASSSRTDLREQLRPHIEAIGQAEAARRSGVPAPNICNWLSGKRDMTLTTYTRLCLACGVTPKIDGDGDH